MERDTADPSAHRESYRDTWGTPTGCQAPPRGFVQVAKLHRLDPHCISVGTGMQGKPQGLQLMVSLAKLAMLLEFKDQSSCLLILQIWAFIKPSILPRMVPGGSLLSHTV